MPCNIYKKTGIYLDKIETTTNLLKLNEVKHKQLFIDHSSLNAFSKEFMMRTQREYKDLKDNDSLLKFITINYKKMLKMKIIIGPAYRIVFLMTSF